MLIVAYHSGDMLQPMTNGQFSLENCNSTSREYSDKAENNTKEIYKLNVRKSMKKMIVVMSSHTKLHITRPVIY